MMRLVAMVVLSAALLSSVVPTQADEIPALQQCTMPSLENIQINTQFQADNIAPESAPMTLSPAQLRSIQIGGDSH